MKNLKYIFWIAFGLIYFLTGTKTFAVPAYPYPILYSQPNGDTLTLTLRGDEFVKFAQTADGYTLLRDNNGYFCYAQRNTNGDIEPSVYTAKSFNKRSLQELFFLQNTPKNLNFSQSQLAIFTQIKNATKGGESTKAFPTQGSRKLLCILMNFKDKPFVRQKADFENLFNQVGYKYNVEGATGSVKDYFLECSYNQLNLTVDVAGPYTADYNMAYYGANNSNGNDVKPSALITEAVKAASKDVNYANYDNDNDGSVDGVYVIFAGYGEEAGASSDAIWSHASSISPLTFNGKRVSTYSCSPELMGKSGSSITGIGVICHEFGHVLGAMDYYDTDYKTDGQYDGLGTWCLMSSGCWNNNSRTPAHPNPRIKIYNYKWATATVLNSPKSVTMLSAHADSASFYRINTTTNNEYFLLENRQQKSFDSYIPGHGLMIYHCHSGIATRESANNINSTHPQHFYPVACNATIAAPTGEGKYGTINSTTCPWGNSSKTNFTDATTPSMKSWANANTGKPITDIAETGLLISFNFMGGGVIKPKVNTLAVTEIAENSATLNGSFLAGTEEILKKGFDWKTVTTASSWTRINITGTDLTYSLTNLSQGTQYAVRAFVITASDTVYGQDISFFTLSSSGQTVIFPNISCTSYDTLFLYSYLNNKGYVTGYNAYGAVKYAQKYNLPASVPIAGVRIYIVKAYSGNVESLNVNLYSIAANGNPITATPLATKQFSTNDIPTSWGIKDFYFNTPVYAKDFFVSIDIPIYSNNSTNIIIASTKKGCASGENSYTYGNYKTGNNWYKIKSLATLFDGDDLDLIIFPIQGAPPITPPKVVTDAVTNITQNSATLKGTVTVGSETITSRGFEYKLYADTSWTSVNATGTTSITHSLSGLIPASSYYVRAYAVTSQSKTYGNIVSFNTLNFSSELCLYPNSCGTCTKTDSARFYIYPNNKGFITGSNEYNSVKYAQKYSLNLNTKILGARVYILKHYSGDIENLKVEMFSAGNNGAPGTVLTSKNYSTSEISGTAGWKNFYFKTPVTAKDFLLSVEVPAYTQSSSDIAIGTPQMGCGSSSDSYVYRDLGWFTFASALGVNLDLFILPIVEEIKPSGVTTGEVTDISSTSAQFHGTVVDNGTYKIAEKGFEWRQGTGTWTDIPVVSASFSHVLSRPFVMSRIYSVRAYIITPLGKTYGEIVEFSNNPNSIHDINAENGILIYPNPVHEQLTVNCGELNIETIEITDILGKRVMRHKFFNDFPVLIDVSSLKSGVYFISIQTAQGLFTEKFVKE